jgi:hypothetical protein
MPLHGELAEGCLEPVFVGVAFDFQGFVVAALGSGHRSNPPELHFHSEAPAERRGLRLNEK